ncbi:MAG: tyrosine-type recombinase/integrase, partial [Candidatus Nanohalobium sp.]
MVEAARNPRDQLIPILLLDAGALTKEVRKVKLGDIEKHSEYWEVTFMDSKNGKDDRPLQLTHCIQQLRNWLENHPCQEDPEAPLLVNLSNKGEGNRGNKLSAKNLNEILKRLGKRADLQGIDPNTLSVYDFRHSSATFRGTEKNWGIQRMLFWYAWKKPDRAKTYCHENEKRMRKAILADKGITPEDQENSTMQLKTCPRCEKERSTDADYCPRCSLPLDTEKAMKDSKLKQAGQFLVEM